MLPVFFGSLTGSGLVMGFFSGVTTVLAQQPEDVEQWLAAQPLQRLWKRLKRPPRLQLLLQLVLQ
jgi:hypothetical protein